MRLDNLGPRAAAAAAIITAAAAAGQTAAPDTPPASPPAAAPAAQEKLVYVLMETSKGDIVLELNRAKAPVTVANFLGYMEDGFYDGTLFHRVIAGFMIQGGGLTPDMVEKPTKDPIVNEWRNGLKNKRGTIAMARRNDPDSATSEFFINVADNPDLDKASPMTGGAGYAVFGKVVAGMEVVEAIEVVPTGLKARRRSVPILDVVIEKVTRISEDQAKQRMEPAAPPTSQPSATP